MRYPPPPLVVQNLENKRFILSLCARSLSLKELHAKSREHGSYSSCLAPLCSGLVLDDGTGRKLRPWRGCLGAGKIPRNAWLELSKTGHYLVDNALWLSLSDLKDGVNGKRLSRLGYQTVGRPGYPERHEIWGQTGVPQIFASKLGNVPSCPRFSRPKVGQPLITIVTTITPNERKIMNFRSSIRNIRFP
jgi:hypothetical protein